MTPTPRTDAIAHRGYGPTAYITEMTDFARQLERELAVWKHDVKLLEAELQKFDQATIEWWCEYQDLKAKAGDDRAEIAAQREQVAILRSDEKRLVAFAKTYRMNAEILSDKLASERELADKLAETLANVQGDYATTGAIITQEVAESLAAWEEARNKA